MGPALFWGIFLFLIAEAGEVHAHIQLELPVFFPRSAQTNARRLLIIRDSGCCFGIFL